MDTDTNKAARMTVPKMSFALEPSGSFVAVADCPMALNPDLRSDGGTSRQVTLSRNGRRDKYGLARLEGAR